MATSPNIVNYTVGKGIPSFKKIGDSVFRDMGNVTTFEFTPSVTTLDHFSTRSGVKKKDKSITTQVEGALKIVMEEWTAENMALALLADVGNNSSGQEVLDILQNASVNGEIKFTMTNEVGPRGEWHFLNVSFVPGSAISPLSDEWGNFEADGQVLAYEDGKFGTVTRLGGEADDPSSS